MGAANGSMLGIPAWNQNRDPLPDGNEDPYHDSDCGEECAAMRIYYRTGLELPAGVLRTLIPGHGASGATTGPELVGVMRLFHLSPVYREITGAAIQAFCTRSIVQGTPPILIGNWVSPHILHWVLGVDAGRDALTVNDPWGGVRRYLPWDIVLQRYAGGCIL